MVMAAVTWFALLLPVGARAVGQLVTLADPVTEGKARVVAPGALRVAEYNDPARRPFTDFQDVNLSVGQSSGSATFADVPAGFRLVIDTISARAVVPDGQRATVDYVEVNGIAFFIPLSFAGSGGTLDTFQALVPVRIFVDPGEHVGVYWARNSGSGTAFVTVCVSGHLVKL
jgi:hypothetical protein